jgi:hypothetical protein
MSQITFLCLSRICGTLGIMTLPTKPWEKLLISIQGKMCTPIIGPGACAGNFPRADEIAREWALEYDYPRCRFY